MKNKFFSSKFLSLLLAVCLLAGTTLGNVRAEEESTAQETAVEEESKEVKTTAQEEVNASEETSEEAETSAAEASEEAAEAETETEKETESEAETETETETETELETETESETEEEALCSHGTPGDECAICEIEARIDALPSVSKLRKMSTSERNEVYDEASDICDAYYELSDEGQEQVSNIDTLWDILDYFSGAISLTEENDTISYIYYDNDDYSTTKNGSVSSYTTIESSTTTWGASNTTTWYVASGKVTISSRITVLGNVNLILTDGCSLTASSGICVNSGNTLTIYGQAKGTGTLTANAETGLAGIGGNEGCASGAITINGGIITATGGSSGAGIGGGYSSTSYTNDTITINGGTITAKGGLNAAGIGGGYYGSGTVIINGGAVTASGNYNGAGIGGGWGGSGTVTIKGGEVTANGGVNGIGAGYYGTSYVYIYGGEVTCSQIMIGGMMEHYVYVCNSAVVFSTNAVSTKCASNWVGIVFMGKTGTVYGDVTLTSDLTIPEGYTLTVPKETSLTVSDSVTLTVEGTLSIASDAAVKVIDYGGSIAVGGSGTITGDYTPSSAWAASITITSADKTYDGAPISADDIEYTYTGNGMPTIAWYSNNDGEKGDLIDAPSDAGTYWVGISASKTAYFSAVSEETKQFTIAKAASAVMTAPIAVTDLTYSGSAKALVTSGSASGGKMVYSLMESGVYAEDIPTGTNAGNYVVFYKVSGDSNHNDSCIAYVTASIAQKSVTATVTAEDKTYDGTATATVTAAVESGVVEGDSLSISGLTGTFASVNVADSINVTVNTENARVSGTNYNNYSIRYNTTGVKANITKATPAVTAPKAKKLTYTGKELALVTEGSATGGTLYYSLTGENDSWSTSVPTGTDVGTYTVYYKVVGNSNYKDVDAASVSVTISKKSSGGSSGSGSNLSSGSDTGTDSSSSGSNSADSSSSGSNSADSSSSGGTQTQAAQHQLPGARK